MVWVWKVKVKRPFIANHIHSLHWIWKYFVPWILLDRASKYETILNSQAHIPSPISFGQESYMSSRCRFEEPPLSCMPANGSKRSIADEDLFSFPGVMCLLLTSNWHHVWWWSIPCFREHVYPAPFDGFHPGPGLQSGKPEDRGLVAQAVRSEGNPDHQHR